MSLIDVDSRKESQRFPYVQAGWNFVASETNWLAVKPWGKNIEVYEVGSEPKPKLMGELTESEKVTSGAFDGRGRWFIGVRDGLLWRWQLQRDAASLTVSVEKINEEKYGSVTSITNVCTDAGGNVVAVAGGTGEHGAAVDIWDATDWTYKRSSLIYERGFIDAMALTNGGKLLALGGDGRYPPGRNENISREERFAVRIASTDDLVKSQTLLGHRERVMSLHFSADGNQLASGSADKSAIVWKIK